MPWGRRRTYHDSVQRLFSMFPTGGPGVALLLLRISLGMLLLHGVLESLSKLDSHWVLVAPWAVAVGLGVGLGTPVFAVLTIVIEVSTFLAGGGSLTPLHVCAILDAIALTLLGPGGYSLDAKFFGRRRIVFPPPADEE
jgi:hypothetical protein